MIDVYQIRLHGAKYKLNWGGTPPFMKGEKEIPTYNRKLGNVCGVDGRG
jgi:hypothetical protein